MEAVEKNEGMRHGNSTVVCQPIGIRQLTTVHLNTTTASVLQFALSK